MKKKSDRVDSDCAMDGEDVDVQAKMKELRDILISL